MLSDGNHHGHTARYADDALTERPEPTSRSRSPFPGVDPGFGADPQVARARFLHGGHKAGVGVAGALVGVVAVCGSAASTGTFTEVVRGYGGFGGTMNGAPMAGQPVGFGPRTPCFWACHAQFVEQQRQRRGVPGLPRVIAMTSVRP